MSTLKPSRSALCSTRREFLQSAAAASAVALTGVRLHADTAPAPVIREVQPLSIRGVNYYPALTPWSGFWTKTPPEVIAADLALAASLNANTIRTFLDFSQHTHAAGLTTPDGEVADSYFAKVDQLLAAGWQHGIRTMLCFSLEQALGAGTTGEPKWKRFMRGFAQRYANDGRVLMWDLVNEPDGREWTPETEQYLREALPFIKTVDDRHLTTVGLAWRIDLLEKAGLPDVLQYHEYAPKAELFANGEARVAGTMATQRKSGGARPVLIGEFGMSTARDPQYGAGPAWQDRLPPAPGTEADQAKLFEIVLKAAETQRAAGALAWCLHSYPTQEAGFLTPPESMFGLIRHDGSLKPAAITMRNIFRRWAASA